MFKNKEKYVQSENNIILKKYHLWIQIEIIDEPLCQQQQMWTIY